MDDAGAEPMFQSTSPSVLSISGSATKALKIAFDKFAVGGKDVRDFDVIISERLNEDAADSADIFIVTFMGKLAPGKMGLGTANRVSGSPSYFIFRERL